MMFFVILAENIIFFLKNFKMKIAVHIAVNKRCLFCLFQIVTHHYEDKNFFKPQQVAGSPTMNSVCNNYDDGQMLFIHSVP